MPEIPPAPPEVAGFQKRYLRSLAQRLEPVVWIGDEGISAGVLRALAEALATHELIKVRMRAPEDKRAFAADVARATGSVLAGLIGHTVILYRANPDQPNLKLPTRPGA